MSLTNEHAVRWVGDLKHSLDSFDEIETIEDKLTFLSTQYFRLVLLVKAIDGEVQFVGVPPIDFT